MKEKRCVAESLQWVLAAAAKRDDLASPENDALHRNDRQVYKY